VNGHPRHDGADRGRRKLRLFELWQRQSSRGTDYLSGFWGDLSLVAFCEERPHPKRPDETVRVWTVLAEERDPTRRPGGRP
jgi:hypothetical protein